MLEPNVAPQEVEVVALLKDVAAAADAAEADATEAADASETEAADETEARDCEYAVLTGQLFAVGWIV